MRELIIEGCWIDECNPFVACNLMECLEKINISFNHVVLPDAVELSGPLVEVKVGWPGCTSDQALVLIYKHSGTLREFELAKHESERTGSPS